MVSDLQMGTTKHLVCANGLSLPIPQCPLAGKCDSRRNYVRFGIQSTKIRSSLSMDEILPNAQRRARDPHWSGSGFSLGIDLGLTRTGVALSKGFSFRPLTVLELRGQKLEVRLLDIAQKQEVDEFIIGLPLTGDGKETTQSNKVRSVAGRLAIRAAEKGWRVYLQEEYGTSTEAMNHMIDMGLSRSTRQEKIDAYAAVMVLERYFSMAGEGVELVIPKQLELQNKLRKASSMDTNIFLDGSCG